MIYRHRLHLGLTITCSLTNCEQFQEPFEPALNMTSQGTDALSPTEFALFPNHPKELKVMIWKKTLPSLRIVELEYHQGVADDGGLIMKGYFTSCCPVPVILSVCQESRSEAKNHYELSFPTMNSGPKVYFNPSIDTLVLSWRGILTNAAFPLVRSDVFDKVEHICSTSWRLEYALGTLREVRL